jgi:multiple sugar transport system substrate-binding protein
MRRDQDPRQISRRRFLSATATAVGGLTLAACGAGGAQTPAEGTEPTVAPEGEAPATGAEPTVAPAAGTGDARAITFWWWDDNGNIWANAWNESRSDIRVNFVNTPFADAHDKLLTSFAAGSGAPDVASVEIGRVGGFTARGGLADLKAAPFDAGRYEEDMVQYKWIQGSTQDGRLVCFPWDIGPAGVWYRTDLFEENGLPTEPEEVEAMIGGADNTWEDFFAVAKQLHESSGGNTAMVADAGTDIYGAVYRQQGEGYQEGNKVLIVEKATRPFQLAAQARAENIDADIPWWGADWNAGMQNNAFACMVIAAWMQGGLTRDHPQTVGKWRVVRAPEANYNWGGSFTAIPEQSQNKEAAWEFVQWSCATAEGQNTLFKASGVMPAYKPAWQDPLYEEPVEFFGGQRVYRVWTEIADNIPAILRTPNDLQLDDIVGAELTQVLQEGKDPVQAAQDAEAEALRRVPDTEA